MDLCLNFYGHNDERETSHSVICALTMIGFKQTDQDYGWHFSVDKSRAFEHEIYDCINKIAPWALSASLFFVDEKNRNSGIRAKKQVEWMQVK